MIALTECWSFVELAGEMFPGNLEKEEARTSQNSQLSHVADPEPGNSWLTHVRSTNKTCMPVSPFHFLCCFNPMPIAILSRGEHVWLYLVMTYRPLQRARDQPSRKRVARAHYQRPSAFFFLADVIHIDRSS